LAKLDLSGLFAECGHSGDAWVPGDHPSGGAKLAELNRQDEQCPQVW